jgi:DNA-binding NarL/FixJ family response regulator
MTDARLSAIVVDDEPLARRELRALLAAHQDLAIVGEAEDVDTAAARSRAHHPTSSFSTSRGVVFAARVARI